MTDEPDDERTELQRRIDRHIDELQQLIHLPDCDGVVRFDAGEGRQRCACGSITVGPEQVAPESKNAL